MQDDPFREFQKSTTDDAIDEAIDGLPRGAELARMRDLLIEHQKVLSHELKAVTNPTEKEALKRRIEALLEQIHVLNEEAVINQFVEDTVVFSDEMRKLQN